MTGKRIAALLLGIMLLALCGAAQAGGKKNAYEQYLAEGAVPSLKEKYAADFDVGVTVSSAALQKEKAADAVVFHFSSLTSENEMSAEAVLDRDATLREGNAERAALTFGQAETPLAFARDQGLRVRAPGLIRNSGTPRWFFAENWDDSPDAPLADRDTMLRRMENYIRDEMTYVNEAYPGLVCAWDVVADAVEPSHKHERGLRTKDSLWYQTVGEDYIEQAFAFARACAAEGQQLFYSDRDCTARKKQPLLTALLSDLRGRGLVDGLSMDCSMALKSPTLTELEKALTAYAGLGLVIQLTNLEVQTTDATELGQMRLAVRYKNVFALLTELKTKKAVPIESVTFGGLTDDPSAPDGGEAACPLLFDAECAPKAAFFGALQDDAIPTSAVEAQLQKALDALNPKPEEEKPVNVLKTLKNHNPVMVQRFGADPWAMVYNGRVYLYMTGDEPVPGMNGKPSENTYGNITTLRVLSSDDLVNWTDHGSIKAAGRYGAAKWATNSWAPCAAWKTIDGQDKFFLYFANSGGGIGVLTADSPVGPFTDPLGKALISRNTPTCASVTWLFDPAVLVDDDGSAYLYFGGGIPDGKASDPGTARAVKLGDDMISLDGTPVQLNPPWLFEDSGINKMGDTYVYSYCSNFNVPSSGSKQGFGSGEIVYMTSSSPLGPFEYGGRALRNPGSYFGVGGNNHHCMFQFEDEWYISYHAATVDKALGWNAGYRSTFVDRLQLTADGLPGMSQGTMAGVEQVRAFDPYRTVSAATACALAGVDTRLRSDEDQKAGSGDMAAVSTSSGGWIGVAGVDFGADGAGGVTVRWRCEENARLFIVLDDPNGEPAASLDLPPSEEGRTLLYILPREINGVHDLYFRFEQPGVTLETWEFHEKGTVESGSSLLTLSDFPDPSVIRVEDTYYLASTTMHFSPGCVLLRSYDLIHWEYLRRVYDVLDDSPMRRLENGKDCYGKGMWAPSLRYHGGTYYLCFTAADTHSTYVFTTDDIENGSWTKRTIRGYYHDPSLFLDDDGRAYIAYGNNQIRLTELKSDLSGPLPGGLDRVLVSMGSTPYLAYEGSHLEKVNGRYYLFVIHSKTTAWRRVESCFAADDLAGEFTGGVVFDDDLGYFGQGIAQGGIVDTPDGRWFAVFFQDRGALGRTPVLIPMDWEGGMPVIGVNGKAPKEAVNLTTRPGYQYQPLTEDDDFSAPEPGAMWEWNHAPAEGLWRVGGGALALGTDRIDRGLLSARDTLTVRATFPVTDVEVTVDGADMRPGDRAGLCALQVNWIAAALCRTEEGWEVRLMRADQPDGPVYPCGEKVTLRLRLDFTGMRDQATCYYRDGDEWVALNKVPHRVSFDLKQFVGVRPGLFCYATQETGGQALFTDFRYGP